MTRPAYPEARRSRRRGRRCTAPSSPTRTAGSRTPTTPRPSPGRRRRTTLLRPQHVDAARPRPARARGWPSCSARAWSARRPGAATGSSSCGAPPSRSTPSCSPSTPTAPSGCWSTRSALDPTGADDAGRLAALEGGPPAGLPALRRRHRGVGAARDGRRHRRAGRRPDRPRALLPRRLAARRRGLLLRAPARARARARRTRSSTTAGSGCTGSGTDPDDRRR